MNDKPLISASPDSLVTTSSTSTGSTQGLESLWVDPLREQAFHNWLARVEPVYGLVAGSLRQASSDAGFRRYLRIDTQGGHSLIIMDAPPALENCEPFVRIAALMRDAGLRCPDVLDWDEGAGFMLLSDLGSHTMLDALDPLQPEAARPYYLQAIDALITLQLASKPGNLPVYDAPVLHRELQLFPDWYLTRHRGAELDDGMRETFSKAFDLIVARNLASPQVYVHRDFMPRNLMPSATHPQIGVLDFQDALYGPATYDIACLMRDAFLSWDEEFVIDITVRYWERARKVGLMDFEDWSSDFGSFWRAVEWMGLQRHLKVAGIFARLSLRDGKPKYLADTPRFIHYIRRTADRYRELGPFLKVLDTIEGTPEVEGWSFGRM
ncbi:aminoglycoside phosphotransferase family protein [Ottowia thiooxydans]|uniref:aminoglycoside phosphotransferase family protein n=1 Tax=Ottowia thiooxydans TaxID=219182 RepID=UPI0004081172|nr:phosphotransferase [Ottowia thiooxydans]